MQPVEKDVYIIDEKESARMIIELLPEEEIKKRLQKAEKETKKKGRQLGAEYKSRVRLNIFITNISKAILDKIQAFQISINPGVSSFIEFIEKQVILSIKYHLLDKKKNKISLYELIQMK